MFWDFHFLVEQVFLRAGLAGHIGTLGAISCGTVFSMFILDKDRNKIRHYFFDSDTGKKKLVGASSLRDSLADKSFISSVISSIKRNDNDIDEYEEKFRKTIKYFDSRESFHYIYSEMMAHQVQMPCLKIAKG